MSEELEAGTHQYYDRRANRSASIAALAEALSKAQGAMEGALKDSSNPFFKSKYADLASVWSACRRPLADNGLAVVQMPSCYDGSVQVETVLMHSSGEWISSSLTLRPTKDDPQGVGSTISYARRYALASMVGVYQEDDDGNRGSGKQEEPAEERARDAAIAKAHGVTAQVGTLEAGQQVAAHKIAKMREQQPDLVPALKASLAAQESLRKPEGDPAPAVERITALQVGRFWKVTRDHGWDELKVYCALQGYIPGPLRIGHVKEMAKANYDKTVAWFIDHKPEEVKA